MLKEQRKTSAITSRGEASPHNATQKDNRQKRGPVNDTRRKNVYNGDDTDNSPNVGYPTTAAVGGNAGTVIAASTTGAEKPNQRSKIQNIDIRTNVIYLYLFFIKSSVD